MSYKLLQEYWGLTIGSSGEKDKLWVKKLKNILNNDIHKSSLGCKIQDTHIKIGDVHLGSFFEAQILFSHSYWVMRFAGWLSERIIASSEFNKKNIVLIGYETYVEPVLYNVYRNLIKYNSKKNVTYSIYEEKKFIQANRTTDGSVFRYLDELNDYKNKDTSYIFICGVSSTLTTFNQMIEELISKQKSSTITNKQYSIVQVLPNVAQNSYEIKEKSKLSWHSEIEKKIVERWFDERLVQAEYLVDVKCEWQQAAACKWCYPKIKLEERPIIATSETSVIPVQMIHGEHSALCNNKEIKAPKIDLFVKTKAGYKYKQFLYYNHIDRDGHHYQYYIRTGHLFREIYFNDLDNFKTICEQIKKNITDNATDGQSDANKPINIIISPRHFSDGMFPQAINEFVFDNSAHIIAIDVKKEFRSNFNTKYSNFEYFLEQVNGTARKINFYYVDDQIISGSTFYRAKSLVQSLMRDNDAVNIFKGVIVLVNRLSESSKRDFVNKKDANFFSFIDIAIPSIRSYGDSCPICKLIRDAHEYQKVSALCCTAYHWAEKQHYHRVVSLSEAKQMQQNAKIDLIERHFRRFAIENLLWAGYTVKKGKITEYIKGIGAYGNAEDISNFFANAIKHNKFNESAEEMISFVKAISRAFIYYMEDAKKAALKMLITLTEYMISNPSDSDMLKSEFVDDKTFLNNREKYVMLVVLLNALAAVESTYMLDIDIILKIYKVVLEWQRDAVICICRNKDAEICGNKDINICRNENKTVSQQGVCVFIDTRRECLKWWCGDGDVVEVESIYSVVLNAYKRIICGISGKDKLSAFVKRLDKLYIGAGDKSDACPLTLLKAIMLESINECDKLPSAQDMTSSGLIKNYGILADKIKSAENQCNNFEIQFCYFDCDFGGKLYILANEIYAFEFSNITGSTIKNAEIKEEVDRNGFYNYNNIWLISLRHFELSNFGKKLEFVEDKGVYLLVSFDERENESEYDRTQSQIKQLQKILKHRYYLAKNIYNDLNTGAIKSAVQARKAQSLLNSEKMVSHGGNVDFLQMADIAYTEIIKNFNESTSRSENRRFIQIGDIVNSMMNMFISYANTVLIRDEFFNVSNNHAYETPFMNAVQRFKDYDKKNQEIVKSVITEYFEEISNADSLYLKHIGGTSLSSRQIAVCLILEHKDKDATVCNNASKFAEQIKIFPNILKTLNSSKAVIFIIGIVDLWLRNAVKHGKIKDDRLEVQIELSTEKGYEKELCLKMRNLTDESACVDNGSITWRFLSEYLGKLNFSSNHEKYSFSNSLEGETFEACLRCTAFFDEYSTTAVEKWLDDGYNNLGGLKK